MPHLPLRIAQHGHQIDLVRGAGVPGGVGSSRPQETINRRLREIDMRMPSPMPSVTIAVPP